MKNKTKRLIDLKEILSTYKIGNQEELLNHLKDKGHNYTQATLSRDLKFLKVAK